MADLHTKVSGECPPNRTKFFHFYICFHRKAPVLEVGAPSNEGWRPPMGNAGSAPAKAYQMVGNLEFKGTDTIANVRKGVLQVINENEETDIHKDDIVLFQRSKQWQINIQNFPTCAPSNQTQFFRSYRSGSRGAPDHQK